MTRLGSSALFGAALAASFALAAACSLQNQEGPNVTCAQLECGRVNACENGIIAQCLDRKSVIYHVCAASGEDVCDEDWQIPGQYRCLETETDCEGCRPERVDGCGVSSEGGAGGTGGSVASAGGGGSSSSAGGGSGSSGSTGVGGAGGTGGG